MLPSDNIAKVILTIQGIMSQSTVGEHVFSYTGSVDEHVIHDVTTGTEQALMERGVKKSSVKKCFNILIEGLQNSLIHSQSIDEQRYVGVQVFLDGDEVKLNILSLIDDAGIAEVKESVSALNKMDRTTLKSHYLQVMSNGVISEKGGAGLGLITMVLKSSQGMQLSSTELDDGLLILESRLSV